MSVQFILPNNRGKVTQQTLAKGFGLPIVKRAFLNAQEIDTNGNFDVGDPEDGRSWMGTPLFSTLYFKKPETTEYIYDEEQKKYVEGPLVFASNASLGDSEGCLIEGCILEVNETNNVVTTQISGLNGSIDEYISAGDSIVTIRGFFDSRNPNEYPRTDTEILRSYCRAGVALDVVNDYLNDTFGISSLVVLGHNFWQQQGMRNVQYFEITCKSSITFTIEDVNA